MYRPTTSRRLLRAVGATVAGTAGLLALAAAPAAAQACYPPGPNCVTTTRPGVTADITVSDRTVGRGQSITIRITGFKARSDILIQIRSHPQDLATVTTDEQGAASATITIPTDMELGRHDIVATGVGVDDQPLEVREGITVVAAPAAQNGGTGGAGTSNQGGGTSRGGNLARTGSDFVAPTAAAGVALVGTGVLLRRSVRRRKTVTA